MKINFQRIAAYPQSRYATKKGNLMSIKPPVLFLLTSLFGFLVLSQTLVAKELEGGKPFIPSRLDWLATTLNAYYRIEESSYSLLFVPIENQNAILIYVRYWPKVNRETMNLRIENAKELIRISAKSYGWNSWLKIKENVKMNGLDKNK